MALIFECDHPGCQRRAPGSWLPSGRLIKPAGEWWIMPQDPLIIACCQAHLPGVPVPEPAKKNSAAPTPVDGEI